MGVAALLAAATLLGAGSLQARQLDWQRDCGHGEDAAGVVRGRLVAASGTPELNRVVQIADGDASCSVRAAPDGRFELAGLRPGSYELSVRAALGLRPLAPFATTVGATAVDLLIRIEAEDRLGQCAASAACARVLSTALPSEVGAGPDRQAGLLGHRLALVLAGGTWMDGADAWVACVAPDASVIDAIRTVYAHVAPDTECDFAGSEREGGRERPLEHVPSGRPARKLGVSDVVRGADGRGILTVTFRTSSSGGEVHDCEVRLVDDLWEPLACTMTLVF